MVEGHKEDSFIKKEFYYEGQVEKEEIKPKGFFSPSSFSGQAEEYKRAQRNQNNT